MHQRETEITTLNGVISRYGKELGIPTPANDIIVHMITLTERNYGKMWPDVK